MAPHHHTSHRRTLSATKFRSLFWFLVLAVLSTPSLRGAQAAPSGVTRTLYELPKMSTSTLALSIGRTDIPIPSNPAPGQERPVVWTQTIDIKALQPERKNIIWTRLQFAADATKLRMPSEPATGGWGANLPGDILKITNDVDSTVQYFNGATLKQWSFNSAFFNGGKLTLQLLADPTLPTDQTPSVVVTAIKVNADESRRTDTITLPPPNTLCNANDDRRPSADARIARMMPVGCTGWTINDPSNSGCQLTAGHCFDGADLTQQVLQFNPPRNIVIRTQAGDQVAILRHPPAEQQFAVDVDSVQFKLTSSWGSSRINSEDWGYFGVHPNPNTGLRPREQFGNQAFDLAPVDPTSGLLQPGVVKVGDQVTVRGHGVVKYAQDRFDLSQVQQTHTGSVQRLGDAYHIDHRADTEGGNSGSPIILANGQSVGIHTNGGCSTSSRTSANWGSTVAMRGLRAALAAPKGICKV